jgi:hypothetical protein
MVILGETFPNFQAVTNEGKHFLISLLYFKLVLKHLKNIIRTN